MRKLQYVLMMLAFFSVHAGVCRWRLDRDQPRTDRCRHWHGTGRGSLRLGRARHRFGLRSLARNPALARTDDLPGAWPGAHRVAQLFTLVIILVKVK